MQIRNPKSEIRNPNDRPGKLGVITHGSLQGVEMKLEAPQSVEGVENGRFVVVQGEQYDFFSMITDVRIEAANEAILLHPPAPEDTLLRRVMQGLGTYATVELKPMLMMPNGEHPELAEDEPRSVKTVPAHFSPVAEATEDDVARVFGHETHEGGNTFFEVGSPLGMDEIPVCLHLERFVERSNAVFGKTGTGKTFVTRLLLCGLIRTGRAVNLIFDMHSEYGFGAQQEDSGLFVKGLRDLFPSQVSIFSLDPKSTRQRTGVTPDYAVYLYADQVEPEDILPLRDTLNLNETAAESSYLLQKTYGKAWLQRLLDAQFTDEELAEATGAHPKSVEALRRKINRIARHDFFQAEPSSERVDVMEALLENIEDGHSIVFEFGRYASLDVYLFVANVITRRLRRKYEEKTNTYLQTKNQADKPRQLVITIEEAHKFLTPEIARETPFGKIAREMRKYYVSLLVVDQRPSAIDDEVLSQIGTKLVAQLSDEKDIAAALVGTSDASALRQVLASLDAKQQALLLGHAVPMPIVVKTRTYGEDFYRALRDGRERAATLDESNAQMNRFFY